MKSPVDIGQVTAEARKKAGAVMHFAAPKLRAAGGNLARAGGNLLSRARQVRLPSRNPLDLGSEAVTKLVVSPGNAQHIGARPQQEDNCAFSDFDNTEFVAHAGVLGVLADGMGGFAKGDEASRLAVSAFVKGYSTKPSSQTIPEALQQALFSANEAVYALASREGKHGNVGTTLVAAAIHSGKLYWVSVGDSRLYLLRKKSLVQLSTDHIYAKELDAKVQAQLLANEDAKHHPDRESLTSYVGSDELTFIDQNRTPLKVLPGDQIIICSDGLYRALSSAEIVAAALEVGPGDAQESANTLVERAIGKGIEHQDNVSVVILSCAAEGFSALNVKAVPDLIKRIHIPEVTKHIPLKGEDIKERPGAFFGIIAAALLLIIWLWSANSDANNPRIKKHEVAAPSTAETAAASTAASTAPSTPADSPVEVNR